MGKRNFQKISNSYFFSPVSIISLKIGMKIGLRNANKTTNLDFLIFFKNGLFSAIFGHKIQKIPILAQNGQKEPIFEKN